MIPAAVNQTDIKIEISWASRMEVEVLRILRYCKMSGTVINLSALKNLKPGKNEKKCEKYPQKLNFHSNGSWGFEDIGSVDLLLHFTKVTWSAILGLSFSAWCWLPRESLLWGSSAAGQLAPRRKTKSKNRTTFS